MGYEPNVDIQIKVTGLRPGEKLYEELLMAEEGLEATKHDKIHIAEPMDIDMERVEQKLKSLRELMNSSSNEESDKIKTTMKELVPTFKDGTELNKKKIEENEASSENKKIEKLKLIVNDNKEEAIA